MMRTRYWRSQMVLVMMPVLWVLAVPVADALAAPGQAKVNRLMTGLILPYRDYFRPWIVGTPDRNIQDDPAMEWLFEVDAETGQYQPWLAESW